MHAKRLTRMPQVEREYVNLKRDYENSQMRYRELKAKQMEAEVGQQLEKERKGERFSLIDPPQLPEKPSSPIVSRFSCWASFSRLVAAWAMHSLQKVLTRLCAVHTASPRSRYSTLGRNSVHAEQRRSAARGKDQKAHLPVSSGRAITVVVLVPVFWIPWDVCGSRECAY